jgi:hypothetical protein
MKQKLYSLLFFSAAVITAHAQNWLLNGNAGISGNNNFLGTTDDKPVVFRTNNVERMRINKNGNIGIGITNPAARFNVIAGSGVSLGTTDNFLLGSVNGLNLAFDNNEIQARNNGNSNTLYLNYWGGAVWIGNHNNAAVPAIYTATDGKVGIGSSNVTSGYALTVNASSTLNGINVTDPADNYSIYCSKSGSGRNAYFANTSLGTSDPTIYGSNNGYGEGVYGSGNNAAGVYGYSTSSIGVYGKSGSYYGIYAMGGGGAYSAYFNGDTYSTGTYVGSDKTLKQDIHDFSDAMNIINRLQPKQYQYRQDGNFKLMRFPQGEHYGLIAQDVEKILPCMVKETKFETRLANPDADPKSSETINFKALNYTELIPVIIKGMQEQQQTIDELRQQVNDLKQMLLAATSASNAKSNTEINGAYLLQNSPNPVSGGATIRCYVPASVKQAQLLVYNMSGRLMKSFPLSNGMNDVAITTGSLSSGQYSYTLLVDGKKVDTKSMAITK